MTLVTRLRATDDGKRGYHRWAARHTLIVTAGEPSPPSRQLTSAKSSGAAERVWLTILAVCRRHWCWPGELRSQIAVIWNDQSGVIDPRSMAGAAPM